MCCWVLIHEKEVGSSANQWINNFSSKHGMQYVYNIKNSEPYANPLVSVISNCLSIVKKA